MSLGTAIHTPSFLPFFSKGNLQDIMNENSVTGQRINEGRLLELFRGTCLA